LAENSLDKKAIASVLEEMSLLLELTGANPFKSRAFANGARALETLEEDPATLVIENRLESVKGIGKGIAAAITELATRGSFSDHEELKASIPAGLLEILRIPGLGAKKVRALWQELDVTDLEALESAAKESRLRALPGFGAKSEAKILEGIAHRRRYAGRVLASKAERGAEPFVEMLEAHPRVRRVSLAGSLRRRAETVHDVDILVAVDPEDRPEVMDAFTSMASVERIRGRGTTKGSVVTAGGLAVDLRAVAEEEFPYALHHLTGSKDHNTALRSRAKAMGLRMSEWGVFRGEERLGARDEAEVFGHLGLPWIPPELREDRGEIETADRGELPDLLEPEDVRGILHVHTTGSDGRESLGAMVDATRRRGYRYLGISDHSVSAFYANGLDADRVREQAREIEALRPELGDFRVFHGIESDILDDGSLDYDDDLLAELDFVIASVHSRFSQDRETMTERVLTAIRHPAVTILGHPTGRLLLAREPYEIDLGRVLDEAGRLGVAVELNANPQRLDLDWRSGRRAVAAGVTIAIGPDAHDTEGLDDMRFGVGIARKGWLTKREVLNCRTAKQVEAFFRRRRRGWTPRKGVRMRYDRDGDPVS
jgi:DNA polymerase (family 10)